MLLSKGKFKMNITDAINSVKANPGDFAEILLLLRKRQEHERACTLYIAEKEGETGVGVIRRGRKLGEWFVSCGAVPGEESDRPQRMRGASKRMNCFNGCRSAWTALNRAFETCMRGKFMEECIREGFLSDLQSIRSERDEEHDARLKMQGEISVLKETVEFWRKSYRKSLQDLTRGDESSDYLREHYPEIFKKQKPAEKSNGKKPGRRQKRVVPERPVGQGLGDLADVRIEIERMIGGIEGGTAK